MIQIVFACRLLVAEGVDGAQCAGPVGGVKTEEHADEHGDTERGDDGAGLYDGFDAHDLVMASEESTGDTEQSADAGKQDRLDEELAENVASSHPERFAHADLSGPFGHGDQHDVHDADSTDEQRDRGDCGEQDGER